jgi:hypothetical protein
MSGTATNRISQQVVPAAMCSRGSTSPELRRAISRRNESFAAKFVHVKRTQGPLLTRLSAVKSPGCEATIDRSGPFDCVVFPVATEACGELTTKLGGEYDIWEHMPEVLTQWIQVKNRSWSFAARLDWTYRDSVSWIVRVPPQRFPYTPLRGFIDKILAAHGAVKDSAGPNAFEG